MNTFRQVARRAPQEWPRWAQVVGLVIGFEQLMGWLIVGAEPNVGAMTFAGALVMFQRIARRREEEE
jgi:hypothetical protein